jgi:hypothetical protein
MENIHYYVDDFYIMHIWTSLAHMKLRWNFDRQFLYFEINLNKCLNKGLFECQASFDGNIL